MTESILWAASTTPYHYHRIWLMFQIGQQKKALNIRTNQLHSITQIAYTDKETILSKGRERKQGACKESRETDKYVRRKRERVRES